MSRRDATIRRVSAPARAAARGRPVIDCDVHNTWGSVDELRPYIAPAFREWFDQGEVPGSRPAFPAAHRPWLHPEDFKRADAAPPNGGNAGSDYGLMRRQLLDRYAVEHAVLT